MITYWRLPDGSCVSLGCAEGVDDLAEAARVLPGAVQTDQPTFAAYQASLPQLVAEPSIADLQAQVLTLSQQVTQLQAAQAVKVG